MDSQFHSIDLCVHPHASLDYCSFAILIKLKKICLIIYLVSKKEFEISLKYSEQKRIEIGKLGEEEERVRK